MIPVIPKPEPVEFDERVRRRGRKWLEEHGIPLDTRLEPGTKIHPYWREFLDDLHTSYDGVCAYLCIFMEPCAGGGSADHFIAKSRRAGLAYEWSNYRFACAMMNSRKRDYDDVLDPFSLAPDTFRLEVSSGRIYPNPHLPEPVRQGARDTIVRLDLDHDRCREMRRRRWFDYLVGRGPTKNPPLEDLLRRYSPFIWLEAKRQGLL